MSDVIIRLLSAACKLLLQWKVYESEDDADSGSEIYITTDASRARPRG